MNNVIDSLVMRRTYAHPRELVFRSWTEAKRLEKWFSPNPKNRVEAEIDLTVGGKYRISMIPQEGDPWVVGGRYRVIDRPERLGFTWKWATDPTPGEGTLVDIDFIETDTGTEIVLTHSNLESEDSYKGHKEGWTVCFDRLHQYLEDPMSALTETSPDLVSASAQIRQAKQLAQMALARFSDTFAHVPEDKLFWSPGETCKSPVQIAVHVSYTNVYFASVLRGDANHDKSPAEIVAEADAKAAEITSRGQVNELLEKTGQETLASFDQLDPARLTTDPRAGFILTLIGRHVDGHAAQIDYLQTTWGDMEDHFGM